MHAFLALAVALAAPALAAPLDRDGYEREIDTNYDKVPLLNFEIDPSKQKIGSKLITKPRLDDVVIADNVRLESGFLTVMRLPIGELNLDEELDGVKLLRRRRGYNLENVRVPARYPYLPVPRYNRFRRWG